MSDNTHELGLKISDNPMMVSVYIDGRHVNAWSVDAETNPIETKCGFDFLQRVKLELVDIKDIAYIMNEEIFEKFCKLWREYHETE